MCSEMGNVSRGVCREERYGVPAGVRTLSPLYVSFSGNVLRRGRKIVLCFFCGAGAHALTKGASEVSALFRALPFCADSESCDLGWSWDCLDPLPDVRILLLEHGVPYPLSLPLRLNDSGSRVHSYLATGSGLSS